MGKEENCTIIGGFEVCNWLSGKGVKHTHPIQIGGRYKFPWGEAKMTLALHSSSMPDGSYGGNPAGVILYIDGKKIYHAGDTGLFGDMKLIGEEGIDLAMLPVGDNFTMGPDDALKALKLIAPQYVIPIHYNTFDLIKQDLEQWIDDVATETTTKPPFLIPGESFEL
jgi:L-ascorbate metabolism protein UlaG (beta-lactamase superfamily)